MFKFPDLLGQELDLNGLTYNGFIRCPSCGEDDITKFVYNGVENNGIILVCMTCGCMFNTNGTIYW